LKSLLSGNISKLWCLKVIKRSNPAST